MTDHEHEGMKKCTKCGEIKPATAEYFNKNGRGGMCSMCRVCRREYSREYYQKNKDRRLECCREYARAPVGRLAQSISSLRRKTGATIYLRDMTEEQKETLANQYVAVITLEKTEKELLAASGKKRCSKCGRVLDCEVFHRAGVWYRAACKACEAKYDREYRQQNKDKIKEYGREYYEKNKDKIKERAMAYYRQKKREEAKKHLTKQNLSPIMGCRYTRPYGFVN